MRLLTTETLELPETYSYIEVVETDNGERGMNYISVENGVENKQ